MCCLSLVCTQGLVGVVKGVSGDTARVELHTKCKTVNQPLKFLAESALARFPGGGLRERDKMKKRRMS